MNFRNEIKAYIVREGFTMSELVEKLAEQYGWRPWNGPMPSVMTSFGRSGDKGEHGKGKDQRYLFQGFGGRS